MCKTSDLIIIVVDANKESLKSMCSALYKLKIEKLFCASSAKEGLKICADLRKKKRFISMLFCNVNIKDISLSDFIKRMNKENKGLISITYSKCDAPETHILNMLNYGSMDYIEQTEDFEENVKKVFERWGTVAKLECDYGLKYGFSEGAI